jgi:thioesterase domain-containing protein
MPQDRFRFLVPIKSSGSKMPLYIVHGDGLNLTNFRNLATHLDEEQPLYSLQPKGLDGNTDILNNIEDIAFHYITEVLEHNPHGPYAITGYSFGGYVAIEMKRQLENMSKTVKMLGIFDTDADNVFYKKGWNEKLSQKILRQFPKFLFIVRSFMQHPFETMNYQKTIMIKGLKKDLNKIYAIKEQNGIGIEYYLNKMEVENLNALHNYEIMLFNGILHLFKATERIYFVDDFKYLGWRKFALDGVKVYDIPGDHKTMFLKPNVKELGKMLQTVLDNC